MKKLPLLTLSILAATAAMSVSAQDDITAPGLSAPVTVQVDALGIPTITAESTTDLAYAQGYLHAQDRFFQMDATRRQASGTASELFGPSQLANDIQIRTLGVRRSADRSFAVLDAETKAIISAYADGVNAWLATNPLPPEYGVLEITAAKPWTAIDTIVVGKILAFQLSFDLDINTTIAAGAFQQAGAIGGFDGAALFTEDLYRVAPIDDRVSVPDFLGSIGGLGDAATPLSKDKDSDLATPQRLANPPLVNERTARLAERYRDRILDNPLLAKTLHPRDGRGGSNEWAIAGSD